MTTLLRCDGVSRDSNPAVIVFLFAHWLFFGLLAGLLSLPLWRVIVAYCNYSIIAQGFYVRTSPIRVGNIRSSVIVSNIRIDSEAIFSQ